tara:strand:+ start:22457 stop:22708 length:252 start_codon:yes stop_codon:yes gene_type:complete
MISKSKASVFLEQTLNTTGLQRPQLILVASYLVKTRQAKNVADAIKMLDTGTINVEEIKNLIIQSFQKVDPKPKSEEVDSEIE